MKKFISGILYFLLLTPIPMALHLSLNKGEHLTALSLFLNTTGVMIALTIAGELTDKVKK